MYRYVSRDAPDTDLLAYQIIVLQRQVRGIKLNIYPENFLR